MNDKLISSKTHGVIDFIAAPLLLVLPRLLKFPKRVTNLLTGVAAFHALYSLFTNYELGVVRVLPYKGHLALDTALATATVVAPVMFTEAKPRIAPILVGGGLLEALIVAASIIKAPRKKGWRGWLKGSRRAPGCRRRPRDGRPIDTLPNMIGLPPRPARQGRYTIISTSTSICSIPHRVVQCFVPESS